MGLKSMFAAAIGRPRAIQGEQMVVSDGLLASMVRPGAGGVYFLPVDEIIQRNGYRIYKEMLTDDQVKAALTFKKILIHGRLWQIGPHDDTPQAKNIASFVQWNLSKLNLNHVIEEALTCLEFGFSLAEKVWTRDLWNGQQMVTIGAIKHRDPQNILLHMDEHGNWQGAEQRSRGKIITLGTDKLWLYSYRRRFGNIYGESDLKSAYKSWWAKKFIINFWNVYLERMGAPMTKMTYPLGASDDLKTVLKTILRNLASKTEILVPEGVQIDLIEAQRGGNATYEQALAFHNNSIARAMLMVALLGTGGEADKTRGSDSQSFLHLRLIFKMADEIAQDIVNTFMEQVVKPLVQLNFDGEIDELMPKFIWQDYGQFEGMKVADTIRLLHAAGILDLDQDDVNYCRSILGLPLRDETDAPDEVLRPPPPPPPGDPNAPPPSANQGNERAKKGGDTTTKNSEPKRMKLVLEELLENPSD